MTNRERARADALPKLPSALVVLASVELGPVLQVAGPAIGRALKSHSDEHEPAEGSYRQPMAGPRAALRPAVPDPLGLETAQRRGRG